MKLRSAFLALALLVPAGVAAQQITPGAASVVPLGTDGSQQPLTGSTSITAIAVVPVPALGKNGGVFLTCLWSLTSSTNNKRLQVIWSNTSGATSGGIQLGTNIDAAVTTIVSENTAHIGRAMNATNAQKSFPAVPSSPFGSSAAAATSGAVNTSLPSYLNMIGTLAVGAESITVENCLGFADIIP